VELLEQKHFSSLEQGKGAIEQWVFHYNYERTHQGLGGLLVPADRFHGLSDLVLPKLVKGLDMSKAHWYGSDDIDRSIINLSVDSEGKVTLYLLGRPISL
jgi:hypothetical protein